jgi:hypothetical protein
MHATLRESIDLRGGERIVSTEEHGAVEGCRHHKPVEVLSRERWVINREQPTSGQLIEHLREGTEGSGGSAFVEDASELWKTPGVTDDDSAELQQPGLHDSRQEPPSQIAEVGLQIAGVAKVHYLIDCGFTGLVNGARHDLGEQVPLVREVLVHGLLRDAGMRSHLIHARPEVPTAEEDCGGCLQDCSVPLGCVTFVIVGEPSPW